MLRLSEKLRSSHQDRLFPDMPRQPRSIQFYGLLAVTVPAVLLCAALTYVWNIHATNSAITVAEKTIRGSHEVITEHVVRQMSMAPRVVALNQHLIEEGILNTSQLADWRKTLITELEDGFPGLSAIVWADNQGRTLWIGRYADGGLYWALKEDGQHREMLEWRLNADYSMPDTPSSSFVYDVFNRPWYQTVVSKKAAGWTPPFVWAGGEDVTEPTLGVSFGKPILNAAGEVEQVIDADYSLNDLSQYLSEIAMASPAITFLVNKNDRLLAISDPKQSIVIDGEIAHLADLDDPMIKAASKALLTGGMSGEQSPLDRIRDAQQDFFVMSSRISGELELDWELVSLVPTSVFLSATEEALRSAIVISLFGLLLALVIGRVIATKISRPVQRLAGTARRIEDGDYAITSPEFKIAELNALRSAVLSLGSVLENREQLLDELKLMSRQENLLRRELDHRVKNMLFQISALCTEAHSRAHVDTAVIEDLSSRIHAFSAVHELQNGTRKQSISLKALIESVLSPHLPQLFHGLNITGPEIIVSAQASMTLAMVINELAMNSRKYGALKEPYGHIEIEWECNTNGPHWDESCIKWIETFLHPPTTTSTSGFGTLFLESAIPHELGGSVKYSVSSDTVTFKTHIPRARLEPSSQTADPADDRSSGDLKN